MPLKSRLDVVVRLIQQGHEAEAAAESKEGRGFRRTYRPVALYEDEAATEDDEEDADHWAEGHTRVCRPEPEKPPPVDEEKEEERRGQGHGQDDKTETQKKKKKKQQPRFPHAPGASEDDSNAEATTKGGGCGASCGEKFKEAVTAAMVTRLAALEVEEEGVTPDMRHAWAVAIAALGTVRPSVGVGWWIFDFGGFWLALVPPPPQKTRITHQQITNTNTQKKQEEPAAMRAINQAHEEGLGPAEAMGVVVDAVVGSEMLGVGGGVLQGAARGGKKGKGKGQQRAGGGAKRVACACM